MKNNFKNDGVYGLNQSINDQSKKPYRQAKIR